MSTKNLCLAVIFFLLFFPCHAIAGKNATPFFMGTLGLNTVPTARMDETGTIRGSVSTLSPYGHINLGMQIAKPLFVSLRQTTETSNIKNSVGRLYPGLDIKLRLLQEGRYAPEIALGLQSALGHKRMAAEYLVFSKRYHDLDFTGGMAWGRLGSAAHIKNPLKTLHSRFGKRRPLDGEKPNNISNWFTGEDIGFFAGIEYFTKIEDLSLKADFGADRYKAEKAALNFDVPDPWSIGLNYAHNDWTDVNIALVGAEKLMATLSLKSPLRNWPGLQKQKTKPLPFRHYRTGLPAPSQITSSASRDNILLRNTGHDTQAAWTTMEVRPDSSLPQQLGRAARHMANHSGETIEKLSITPARFGLHGPDIHLMRRDIEQAIAKNQGSPQEIWQNAEFQTPTSGEQVHKEILSQTAQYFHFVLDQQFSLSEEDEGVLYRTALLTEGRKQITRRLMGGAGIRLNVEDNLYKLDTLRPRSTNPVRNNVGEFTTRRVSIDKSYLSWTTSLRPDLHMAVTGGVLEEMYNGIGGEILFRPFGKTFAFGAEAWQVVKRDPQTTLNLGNTGDQTLTGHLNAWYEVPGTDMTLHGRVGRYLAEDIGGTFSLQKRFANGTSMEAFVTATDNSEPDIFGSTTQLYSGLQLRLPIGNVKYVPDGSALRIKAVPFGRDAGQSLEKPVSLYELSEPLSYRHLGEYWTTLLD